MEAEKINFIKAFVFGIIFTSLFFGENFCKAEVSDFIRGTQNSNKSKLSQTSATPDFELPQIINDTIKKTQTSDKPPKEKKKKFKFGLINFNNFSDPNIAKIVNGMQISVIGALDGIPPDKLNEATETPIWKESARIKGYGAEIAFISNPYFAEIGALYSTSNLKDVKTNFAFPPGVPDDISPQKKLNAFNFYLSMQLIPCALFYGNVFPTAGIIFYHNSFDYNNYGSSFSGLGITTGLNIKYKSIFVAGNYSYFLFSSDYYDSLIRVKAGYWMNFNIF